MLCRALGATLVVLFAVPLYYHFTPPQVHEVRGKCAVVTGASSGLGVVIARRLAAEGVAKLIITARSLDKLEATVAGIAKDFPAVQVIPVKSDVTKDADNAELVSRARQLFGACGIILVNNAGVESFVHFDNTTRAKIDRMLDTNIKGLIHLTHDFLPTIIKSGGHIVNMGSAAGTLALPNFNVYAATKYAVRGFSINLRAEMRLRKYPVTVHCVQPGMVTEAGMGVDAFREAGVDMEDFTSMFGSSVPEDTARAVVEVIKYDHPEVLVNWPPMRPLVVLQNSLPRFMDLLMADPLAMLGRALAALDAVADAQS